MNNDLCKKLGIESPIFAFTHCRDVVVEVSKAGGLGVLGAVGFTVEQLKAELDWIDAHIGDKPYAVDIVIPQKYEGMGETDVDTMREQLETLIPDGHRIFAEQLLTAHGVPKSPDDNGPKGGLQGWTEATALPLLREALTRKNVVMIANALGTPPVDIIEEIHATGRLVGALCGKVKQALSHKKAGVDIIIAQGTEGGGHTGEIGSLVLWPQIIDAVGDTPVLAAGGIGDGRQMAAAMCLGAAGVWTGSLWLAVEEAEADPAEKASYFNATSEDTVRSRSWTGKPCRMLKSDWTEAWAAEDTPDPLGMPMQGMVTFDAVKRTKNYAGVADTQKVAFNPVGQTVGLINQQESCRQVVFRLLNEYADSVERINSFLEDA
ncbi:Putative monooxygenase [Sinobacterium norvegicum]|uniref:Monooxygenase n=1 Tax=Sinobacterium norvegicum TaxID=1641715 RepID=A0ABN8EKL8_9GAMM|nr:nitronate monooxygenase family protein [Sinobacterium norvegicum]CAH0991710.1 Putative monooxygenase [Sinobacterium norvegicum]